MKGLSVRSTANTVLDRLATALAAYATVEQTQTDTKWEPNDRGKQTCQCQTATATKSVQELYFFFFFVLKNAPRNPYRVSGTCCPAWRQTICGWSGGKSEAIVWPVRGSW